VSSRNEALTELFVALREGDESARNRLVQIVYEELRMIARRELHKERQGHTLATGDLVHEAWFRLFKGEQMNWENRRHFFGAAIHAMRCILIDHARRKKAKRHGGDLVRVTLDDGVPGHSPDVLYLDQALDRLEAKNTRMARVVELRYFGGLTIKETARYLEVSERTVNDDWHFAKAWLRRDMASATDAQAPGTS
jgi:RNA polymerase sigma factor (TIGR02999 family)